MINWGMTVSVADARIARRLLQGNPVRSVAAPSKAAFPTGSPTEPGPNCYSWAMNDPGQRPVPGWRAFQARHPCAVGAGRTLDEQRRMFELDGLTRIRDVGELDNLEPEEWIVTVFQMPPDPDGGLDYHLRRLDSSGWSEKRGDHSPQDVRPSRWRDLVHATADEGRRYTLGGFYRTNGTPAPIP